VKPPKDKILEFIRDNPSTHLRKIKNSLGYSIGTTQYHIARLENQGKIYSKKEGFYKNFFHVSDLNDDNEIMSLLNLESSRKIMIYLINNEPCSHSEIARGIGLTSSTVSWHMKKLIESEIVQLSYNGKFSIYSIKNRNKLIHILNRYKDSTWNDMINNMVEIFSSFQK